MLEHRFDTASPDEELAGLFAHYSGPGEVERLLAAAHAQVVRWRWATESMSFAAPFARELYGAAPARWLTDDKAKPEKHVRHGLDAAGRILIECSQNGCRLQASLHTPQCCVRLDCGEGDRLASIDMSRYDAGRLLEYAVHFRSHGFTTRYVYQGERLQCTVTRNWTAGEPHWDCRELYSYDAAGQLARIDLQYLDAAGEVKPATERLLYLALPRGETLKSIEARVQSLLLAALQDALARLPRDEPLYCLLLCYTSGDVSAAWPPFLVCGRESYRQNILAAGEDVSYSLWAPDEITAEVAGCDYWLDEPALKEACLLHAQLMQLKQSDTSALRVLKQVMAPLEAMVRAAGVTLADDFVVAYADNTGAVDPLPALKARLPAEQWAVLKQRGCV
ncbi:hypothetical protein [Chitinilyticum litopenaei]|uniref:hypothetical protein n=1 Tax=Chitinilyticum litopenaei TaxID=1121276 RepID=UPI0003F64B4F|nr:hypothetical protein [Chitinilyticum litopenaei]